MLHGCYKCTKEFKPRKNGGVHIPKLKRWFNFSGKGPLLVEYGPYWFCSFECFVAWACDLKEQLLQKG